MKVLNTRRSRSVAEPAKQDQNLKVEAVDREECDQSTRISCFTSRKVRVEAAGQCGSRWMVGWLGSGYHVAKGKGKVSISVTGKAV